MPSYGNVNVSDSFHSSPAAPGLARKVTTTDSGGGLNPDLRRQPYAKRAVAHWFEPKLLAEIE